MNKHSIRHRSKRSSSKRSSRKLNSRRHRYRYSNKSTKRLIRLKRKTRRIKHTRMRGSRRMRGGEITPVVTQYRVQDPNANRVESSQNTKLGGGGISSMNAKKNMQNGGNSTLALYAYKPPPGMMGPIPQPSQDATSNQLILQAAKISTTGQANAEYDNNVSSCKN